MGSPDFISEAPSLAAAVARLFAVYAQSPHLGHAFRNTEATWCSYAETGRQAACLSAGLAAPPLSVPPRASVAILLPNCIEWLVADFACALGDLVVVGLHAGWPAETLSAVLLDAEITCCITNSTAALTLLKVLKGTDTTVSGNLPLKSLVVLEPVDSELAHLAKEASVHLVGYSEVLATGGNWRRTHSGFGFGAVASDIAADGGDDNDAFTLLYSSGTSGGPPKATAVPKAVWRKTNCTPGPFASIALPGDRRAVSHMALAHGADRGVVWSVTIAGGRVGFMTAEEGTDQFVSELHLFKPTFFLGMSCFWQDRYSEHLAKLLPALDSMLIRQLQNATVPPPAEVQSEVWALLRAALLRTRRGQALERKLLSEARDRMGGSLLLAATGGAHTPEPVLDFMGACLCEGNETRVMDVYGSTEFPGVSTNGAIDPEVELKLIEVRSPDGQLLYSPDSVPPRGEVVVKRRAGAGGGSTRYWKRAEMDAQAWDADGFYHMGDVGELDYHNPVDGGEPRLKIIDRVKNLEEVYWQGDSAWIEASKLEENVYGAQSEVRYVVLMADRNREGVVAIVVVQHSFVSGWLARQQPENIGTDVGALCLAQQRAGRRGSTAAADSVPAALEAEILASLRSAGERAGLKPFELPVACVVELNHWSCKKTGDAEEPLLTITGKPKRGAVRMCYLEAFFARYGRVAGAVAESPPVSIAPSSEPLAASEARPGLYDKAKELLQALEKEAAEEAHSRGQHDFAAKFGSPLPTRKRGSRICDTSFVQEATGQHKTQANKASDRDWLAGTEAFEFGLVRDIDNTGHVVEPCEVPFEQTAVDGGMTFDSKVTFLAAPGKEASVLHFGIGEFDTVRSVRRRIACAMATPVRTVRLWAPSQDELDDDRQTVDDFLGVDCNRRQLCLLAEIKAATESPFYALSRVDLACLTDTLLEVRREGLEIRSSAARWSQEADSQRKAAEAALRHAQESMDMDLAGALKAFAAAWGQAMMAADDPNLRALVFEEPDTSAQGGPGDSPVAARSRTGSSSSVGGDAPLLAATRQVLGSLVRGKRAVLAHHEALGMVAEGPLARQEALQRLNCAITRLRDAGDDCDVDTRALPITWTMDLNWVIPPSTPPTCACIVGCGRIIYQDKMIEHMEAGCDMEVGVADPMEAGESVQMGGSQAVICDVSAVLIDSENSELKPSAGGSLPYRPGERMHSVDSGINRRPSMHAALQFLHRSCSSAQAASVPGAKEAASLLTAFDPHIKEVWVREKQHYYWLHRHVCAGKDLGFFDTPASLVLRACDAFAERPCLGIPGPELISDATLPRRTARTALPSAAEICMVPQDGFRWLRFADLQILLTRVAAGLLMLAPGQSLVAIAGYNDLEWVVADFAVACAGMASVGIHTTYKLHEAVAVFDAVKPALLCATLDLLTGSERADRWDVASLASSGSAESLLAVVATDAPLGEARRCLHLASDSRLQVASFLDMVSQPLKDPFSVLPNPFEARGVPFHLSAPDSQGKDIADLTTLLFTSGSSGKPKAVAVGVDNFRHDIAGDSTEACAFSRAVTVSYIPLSHSSDRYKVWQHIVYGGRVGLCYFPAANWKAHEQEKKDAMLDYSSPVDALFSQVSALRPTNMACPPNIWAGLQDTYFGLCQRGTTHAAAMTETAGMFGDRMQTLATGGSPTPPALLSFARALASCAGASIVDSYGTTESGAIAANGRSIGAKFAEVEVCLVDRPELGLTSANQPHPGGEVVVKSPSLCLGYFDGPGTGSSEQDVFVIVDPPQRPCPEWIQPPLGPGRWYFTRDLAYRDSTGKLSLIDRVGAVVRIKGGHLVRLGHLEALLEGLDPVRYCFCQAFPEYSAVAAVIVLREQNLAPGQPQLENCQASPATAELMERLQGATGASPASDEWLQLEAALGGVKLCVGVAQDEWSVANGLLSGELKKRRGCLLQVYSEAVRRLLSEDQM